MDFTNFIDPGLLILIPVLYLLGMWIKSSEFITDKHIPLILGGTGILLAVIWVGATKPLPDIQAVLTAVFTSVAQGILCAGAAVYGNQIVKQHSKPE